MFPNPSLQFVPHRFHISNRTVLLGLPGIADSGDYCGNGRRLQGKLHGHRCHIRFGSGDDSLNLLHGLDRMVPGKGA
jgi:hypothetical protein